MADRAATRREATLAEKSPLSARADGVRNLRYIHRQRRSDCRGGWDAERRGKGPAGWPLKATCSGRRRAGRDVRVCTQGHSKAREGGGRRGQSTGPPFRYTSRSGKCGAAGPQGRDLWSTVLHHQL